MTFTHVVPLRLSWFLHWLFEWH